MKKQEAHWATIRSPDKNSCCISANIMNLLPVLPQQIGHKFNHIVKRSTVIVVSSFEQTVAFGSHMLYTKSQPESCFSSGEEVFYHIWSWQPSCSMERNHLNKFSTSFRQTEGLMWNLMKLVSEVSEKTRLNISRFKHYIAQACFTYLIIH